MSKCDKCSKIFSNKYLLQRHKLNKLPCDSSKKILSIQNNISDKAEKIISSLNEKNKFFDENILGLDTNISKINNDITKIINNISLLDNKISIFDENINLFNDKIITYENKSQNKVNKCWFCKKMFSSKYNMLRHIYDNCTFKKNIIYKKTKIKEKKNKLEIKKQNLNENKDKLIKDKELIIEDKNKLMIEQEKNKLEINNLEKEKNNNKIIIGYTDEIKLLREQVSKLIAKQSVQNINITNNKIINNNLIVNINSFGKENLSHITLADYKKFLGGFFSGFIKFIEKVHFDENMPENHNISISNLKSKYLHIYENNQWTAKEKADVLDKFINKKFNFLVDKCDELEESNQLSEKIIEDFIQFTQNYKDDANLKSSFR
jgi:hypothetical protein